MSSIPPFVKRVRFSDCGSDDLILPHAVGVLYGSRIPRGVKLVLRNGYSLWLNYNRVENRLEGIHRFFKFFNFNGGETLLFKHCGGFKFYVTVFDIYGCEKDYPTMPNKTPDVDVSMENLGYSFIEHLSFERKITDSIVVPFQYFERIGGVIPSRVTFQVSSGHELVGSFLEGRSRLQGLVNICNMLDVVNLNHLHLLLFTYDGVSSFAITAFDNSLVESSIGPNLGPIAESNNVAFKFVVKGSHMLDYEHGVDIPVEYRKLCKAWIKTDHITAYVNMRCWKLQIRHRRDRKRTTINDGWLTFRNDLQIEEGDLCVFGWMNESIRNFVVRIIKH